MVDVHSSPASADQRRISVDGHQPGLPAQEKPGLRDLPFPGHLPVPGYRCRSVRIEAVVPDLVELPVRDVDEEPCDEAGDAVPDILPAAFPAFFDDVPETDPVRSLRAWRVLQSAYEIGQGVASGFSRS